MASSIQRSLRHLLLAFMVVLGFLSPPFSAVSAEIEGLHGEAAPSIRARIEAEGFRYPTANVFYGDLTGRGTRDALSFVYYDSGGSAPLLATWIWRESKGTYTLVRQVPNDEVFGLDPRNAQFTPGRIEITTSVPQAGDPHCCPTGKRTFILEVGDGGTPENKPAASAQNSGNWHATAKTNPAMVGVTGTATNGKTTFSGGCNVLLGPGLRGSLNGYAGEALRRIDDQSETVTFDVAGRNGTQSFAAKLHYFAPDKAWVISDPLPAAFLVAFAQGNTLTIRNGKGEDVVAFGLSGSSKAVQTMRQICGI